MINNLLLKSFLCFLEVIKSVTKWLVELKTNYTKRNLKKLDWKRSRIYRHKTGLKSQSQPLMPKLTWISIILTLKHHRLVMKINLKELCKEELVLSQEDVEEQKVLLLSHLVEIKLWLSRTKFCYMMVFQKMKLAITINQYNLIVVHKEIMLTNSLMIAWWCLIIWKICGKCRKPGAIQ